MCCSSFCTYSCNPPGISTAIVRIWYRICIWKGRESTQFPKWRFHFFCKMNFFLWNEFFFRRKAFIVIITQMPISPHCFFNVLWCVVRLFRFKNRCCYYLCWCKCLQFTLELSQTESYFRKGRIMSKKKVFFVCV